MVVHRETWLDDPTAQTLAGASIERERRICLEQSLP
jgi:hypothetical protein